MFCYILFYGQYYVKISPGKKLVLTRMLSSLTPQIYISALLVSKFKYQYYSHFFYTLQPSFGFWVLSVTHWLEKHKGKKCITWCLFHQGTEPSQHYFPILVSWGLGVVQRFQASAIPWQLSGGWGHLSMFPPEARLKGILPYKQMDKFIFPFFSFEMWEK